MNKEVRYIASFFCAKIFFIQHEYFVSAFAMSVDY